jgi:peptide/nickel transport system substrate-binding protein
MTIMLRGTRLTRRHLVGVAPLAVGSALVACEATTAPTPTSTVPRRAVPTPLARADRAPSELVHAQYADARTMQPLLARDPASAAFVANHYNAPLMRRDPTTLEWDPTDGTAAGVVLSDGGRSITYTLREGLRWSDGTPLTASDYRFTYQSMIDPGIDHPYRAVYANVASVEAPDDRTLTWTLREAFCPAVDYTVINPIPRHVFEGVSLERHPASSRPTVGSGPFLLREWNQGRNASFEANPSFYLGQPRLDRYTIRLVPDAAAGWESVKAGDADIAAIQASDASDVRSTTGVRVIAHYPATSSWTYLGMNLRHRILSDRNIRHAIAHSIDRVALIREVRLGHAHIIDSPLGRGSWASAVIPGIAYDPPSARRLLDEAGWVSGASGTRTKDEMTLELTMRYPSGNPERQLAATMIGTNLREVGIKVDLVADGLADLVDRVNVTHEYDLCLLGWSVPVEPNGTRGVWTTNGSQNGSGLADATIDALYDEAVRLVGCGREARARAYGEIQRRVAEAIPCVFLFENEALAAVSDRVSVNAVTRLGWDYRPWEWTRRP